MEGGGMSEKKKRRRRTAVEKLRVVLAGLISKQVYDDKAKSLPVNFVVAMILVIILGFIILPFLKVFFLSPKENVFKRDILGIMISVYLGSALLVLSGCYFLADYTANIKVSNQLNTLSDKLENEIHTDLQRAGQQRQSTLLRLHADDRGAAPHRRALSADRRRLHRPAHLGRLLGPCLPGRTALARLAHRTV